MSERQMNGNEMRESEAKKPLNRFFTFVYHVVGAVVRVWHPVSVEGLENLPESGALLCPNHASNWDPVLVALNLPVNYRLHLMGKEELFRNPILGWILRIESAFLLLPLYTLGLTLAHMLIEVSSRYHYSLIPMFILLAALCGQTKAKD